MRTALMVIATGLGLAGCANPYGGQPVNLNLAPSYGTLPPPVPYGSSPAAPYVPLPAYQPPPAPAEPPDDLPPIVFQPNPPPSPETPAAEPYGQSPTAPDATTPDPNTPTASTPAPAIAPPTATPTTIVAAPPDKGGADVPMMGFRPMRGQKPPATSTVP